jgi:membrane-associated phospholipid phosphatase
LTARRLIGVLSLIAFAVLAASVYQHSYFGWDLAVARWLQRIPGLQTPMEIVSVLGYGWWPYLLTGLTVLALIARRRLTEVAFLVASAAVAGLLNQGVKVAIGRPRPSPALVTVTRRLTDQSFPSGHVMFYVSFFGFLFFLAYREPGRSAIKAGVMILASVAILLVGASRVYLGAHWPSDVLGGYLLAIAWLAAVIEAYLWWRSRSIGSKADQRRFAPK